MKQKNSFSFFLLFACLLFLPRVGWSDGFTSSDSDNQDSASTNIDVIPDMSWQVFDHPGEISYHFNPTSLTRYQGTLVSNKLGGLKFGFDASLSNDGLNSIGTYQDLIGYLGYKNWVMRAEQSRLYGTSSWNGALASGQSGQTNFDNQYTSIDAVYELGISYISLGYSSLSLPVALNATRAQCGYSVCNMNGTSVYDPNYPLKTFEFDFGWDTLAGKFLDQSLNSNSSWGFFSRGLVGVGIGQARLDSQTISYAEQLNGEYPLHSSVFTNMIDRADVSFGVKWDHQFWNIPTALGVGYEAGTFVVMPITNGGTPNYFTGFGLNIHPFFLFYQGPVIRLYARW